MPTSPASQNLCFITASPLTVQAFLGPHINNLAGDYTVSVATNLDGAEQTTASFPQIEFHNIPIARRFKPISDLGMAVKVARLLQSQTFDAVISVGPKAGLIVSLVAKASRVPVRIHWFTGQVWAGKKTPQRQIFKFLDRLILWSTNASLVDGRSQRDFLVRERVAREGQLGLLSHGSISGVDQGRFRPDSLRRVEMRRVLGIPQTTTVILFLGRITKDKGVPDLTAAYASMRAEKDILLLVVGPDEENRIQDWANKVRKVGRDVLVVGATPHPEAFYSLADIMVLPSYREGFGTSVIEASASGLPVVVSDIYGLANAVEDGVTGIVFPVGDVKALAAALDDLVSDTRKRSSLGIQGIAFVRNYFAQPKVLSAFESYLSKQLSSYNGWTRNGR